MGRQEALIAATRIAPVLLAIAAYTAAAEPLKVTVPDEVSGDGRSIVPVVVAGKPEGQMKDLPVNEAATISCAGATTFGAPNQLPPAVLAPAVTQAATLECTAKVRTTEAKFQLKVRPPVPGLYGGTTSALKTTDGSATLQTFVWDGKKQMAPGWLHASASDGTVTIGKGGAVTIALDGRAPRTIAVAMADGTHAAAAFIPVSGVTVLPVEADAGSSVQVWVSGTWFGPVPTKGRIAEVPIEVPAGVTHAVARSTDRRGYITDAVIDLKIPARQRIAVVSAMPNVGAGEQNTLALAIAGADGRPGSPKLKVVGTAVRGTVGEVRALGGGLWTAQYTAPPSQGADHVSFRIEGDDKAGMAELDVDVRGIATRIEIDVTSTQHEPGDAFTGVVRVFDAQGQQVKEPALTATLGGETLEVERGDTLVLRGRIPQTLPANRILSLDVVSGSAKAHADVRAGGPPTMAKMRVKHEGNQLIAQLDVRDKGNNLVADGAFELVVTGGKVTGIVREDTQFRATIALDPGADYADLRVRAGTRELARLTKRVTAPPFALAAWASAGWLDNLGALTSPRAGAGVGIGKQLGKLELAALLGAEMITSSDTQAATIEGMTVDVSRSLVGLTIPLTLRARVALGARVGLLAGAAVVPARVRVELDAGAAPDAYNETVFGVRGIVGGDMILGPGRAIVSAMFGRAKLGDGAVVGQIDGLAFTAGYEWWFWSAP